ncbi:hypothetical protein CRG98_021683 [Punica granatum]|uniref:Uncharacterized protein n=1 Tax=Punica granatum TaxID=22663 RepID=A0A2I0JNR5_PUNGR|nr:hypothetical protein CRG98_021683 [Punica granatum]
MAPQKAPGSLLMQACGMRTTDFNRKCKEKRIKKNCGNPVKEKIEKGRSCAVERLSARDHLVTGESDGCEEPLESDGTTRLSREMEKTLRKPGMHP